MTPASALAVLVISALAASSLVLATIGLLALRDARRQAHGQTRRHKPP